MNEKAVELFHNKDFLEKVLLMSPEDAQKEIQKEGGVVSLEELKDIGDMVSKAIQNNGELEEESLDKVAGGRKKSEIAYFVTGVAIGIGIAALCSW